GPAELRLDAALWTVSAHCDPLHVMLRISETGLMSGGASEEVVAAFPAYDAVFNTQHMADEPGLESAIALIKKAVLVVKNTAVMHEIVQDPNRLVPSQRP